MGSAYGLESDTTDEEWFLYAYSQISPAGYAVDLAISERAPGEFNDLFTDATGGLVSRIRRTMNLTHLLGGGADEYLDYQEVVQVFIRKLHSSGQALHPTRAMRRAETCASWATSRAQ